MVGLRALPGAAGSFNPLRVSGTALPPNLLLMAKLIAVAYLLRGGILSLSVPFIPFLPWLDRLPHALLTRGLQGLFVAGVAALLLNRRPRTACLLLGLVVLLAILASRPYYQNNRMFAGSVLLLTGLYQPGLASRLVRYQIVLLYAAAALNKLLDVDWRSGQFFVAWAQLSPYHALYEQTAAALPLGVAMLLLSWCVIATEFAIAGFFMVRRLFPLGIWLGVAYHTSLLFMTGRTFGVFWFALLSSYLAFVDWPPVSGVVQLPTAPNWWRRATDLVRRLDFDGTFRWMPGAGGGLELDCGRQPRLAGVPALAGIVLALPAAYLGLLLVAVRLPEAAVRIPALLVVAFLAGFAFRFLGRRARRAVTRFRPDPATAATGI